MSLTDNARSFAETSYTYTGAEVRLWVHGLCDEIEALRKDAERYRYLRIHFASVGIHGIEVMWDQDDPGAYLDNRLDAFIERQQP